MINQILRAALLFSAVTTASAVGGATSADLTGRWEVASHVLDETNYDRLRLDLHDGNYVGTWGRLKIDGRSEGAVARLLCSYDDRGTTKPCGEMTAKIKEGKLTADGTIFGQPETWVGQRPLEPSGGSPQTHNFEPKEYYRLFSGSIAPALHIFPGDTVHTTTIDAAGFDKEGIKRSIGGNPQSGPFYIEGAMPGDTIAIHFTRIHLNRDTAGMFSDSIATSALNPNYVRDLQKVANWNSEWKLDRETSTATLFHPTDKLKNFKVKLQPMLGCVAVAPPGKQSFRTGDLGIYGGNMDYNQIREGVTLYLPVFQPGAILFVGDAHALQGDGELTGNALETSMDVEFTVEVIEDKSLGQPRAEDADYVMVLGIARSMDDALKSATTGMARWLSETYKLNSAEVAMVLGSSMRYDIAEVVDPQFHIVAKIRKELLEQIPKP